MAWLFGSIIGELVMWHAFPGLLSHTSPRKG